MSESIYEEKYNRILIAREHAATYSFAVAAASYFFIVGCNLLVNGKVPVYAWVGWLLVAAAVRYVAYMIVYTIVWPKTTEELFRGSKQDQEPVSRPQMPIRPPKIDSPPTDNGTTRMNSNHFVSGAPVVDMRFWEPYPEMFAKMVAALRDNGNASFSALKLNQMGVGTRDTRTIPNTSMAVQWLSDAGFASEVGSNVYLLNNEGVKWLKGLEAL